MTQTIPRHNPYLSLVLRSQAKLLSARSLQEAATALANELATSFGLRAVYVGVLTDGSARVIATAHLAAPNKRDLNDPLVTAAMDEAVDQAAVVVFPEQKAAGLNITRAHQMLARRSATALCSVPILADTSPVGALLLEHEPDVVFSADMLDAVEQIAALAGPVIELRQRSEAPLLQRIGTALRPPGKARSPRTRLLWSALAVLALAALLVPLPHTLTAEARIEGEIQRAMVAPVDGFIEKAFVRPGDVVQQGQTLVQLADRELQLERRKLESERAQHDNAFAAAQSEADRGKMVLAHARTEEARARIDLVDHQLERSLIRAPMDSVVLTGNLDQAEGTPVQRGDVLLVLAPQARYRLMIEVDERDVAQVSAGAEGQVALSALPDTAMRFTVQRVMPVTTDRDGRHFVEVEAQLDAPATATQPGMRGYARIETGTSPLLSQLTRRLRGWLELQIWAWLGL